MAARGKRRKRKDGSIADGRTAKPVARLVPTIDPVDLSKAMPIVVESLNGADLDEDGMPTDEVAWQAAHQAAQVRLQQIFPDPLYADAVLWRATFLDASLRWPAFRSAVGIEEFKLRSTIYQVASSIRTTGADLSFDQGLFLDMLAVADQQSSPDR